MPCESTHQARVGAWTFGLLALAASACGGVDRGVGPGGIGGSGGVAADGAPLYAVCGLTLTPDGQSGYLALVPDLEAGTTFDLADTLEFPGGSLCAAPGKLEPTVPGSRRAGGDPTLLGWSGRHISVR